MRERRLHRLMPHVQQQFVDGRMGRRDFLRFSTLLGLSTASAYAFAGEVTGNGLIASARAQDMPRGGRFKFGMRVQEVARVHAYDWVQPSNIANQVVETLTRVGYDNIARPHLCEGWEVSDDLRTWTLFLRPEVTWHSGRPFVADDVIWNFVHFLTPETGSSSLGLFKSLLLNDVDTGDVDDDGNAVMSTEIWDANAFEKVDDHTVRVNLKAATIAMPEYLFFYNTAMYDPEEDGVFGVGSNGTGAFELVEHNVGVNAVLNARSDYYLDGPYLDSLEFIDLGDDPSANVAAVASQQVHSLYQVDASLLPILQSIAHTDVYEAATAATAVVQMIITEPPFDDPKVRLAMRHGIDSDVIVQRSVQGLGLAGEHHFVCPIHPAYAPLPKMERDPEMCRQLLAEAGYPDGIDIEMACKADPAWEIAAVQVMVEQYAECGIRCSINNMPSAQFWEIWDKAPLGFVEWAHRPLATQVLSLGFRTGVPWNPTGWSNADFDRLLSEAEATLDVEERRAIMEQIEIIMQQDGPIAQPVWRSIMTPVDKRVKGFQMHPQYRLFANELAIES